MSGSFAEAVRRRPGQLAEAARELSRRARYTRTRDGVWTWRRWRVGWDNLIHPRHIAALKAEEEDLRRAQEQAEWNQNHELPPDSYDRPGRETLTSEEFEALYPDMTEADIQRHLEFLEFVDRVAPEFEAGQ